ncbi:MAG: hypothetical protein FWH26_04705 [Oscillospiraceae bacterium]|nr:hypothetical protein [Oscillospiraceae bacterium]
MNQEPAGHLEQRSSAEKNKKPSWTSDAFLQNPILVQAIGLAPVVAAATTLRASLIISLVCAAQLVVCEPLAGAVLKKLPGWLRVAVYYVLGLALTLPLLYWLELRGDVAVTTLGLYLPLLALNSLTAVRCERFAVLHTPAECLRDALANALGYAAVALVVGVIRETLGRGSIWGREFMSMNIRGLWMPFGGFLLVGALAALLKVILRFLSERGIYSGADEAMELELDDRQERLEKTQRLLENKEPEPAPEPEPRREPAGESIPPSEPEIEPPQPLSLAPPVPAAREEPDAGQPRRIPLEEFQEMDDPMRIFESKVRPRIDKMAEQNTIRLAEIDKELESMLERLDDLRP